MKQNEKTDTTEKRIVIIANLILILIMVGVAIAHSGFISKSQEKTNREDFISLVESMKLVS